MNSSFRDGRLALGDELVNISGKRFGSIIFFISNSPHWVRLTPTFWKYERPYLGNLKGTLLGRVCSLLSPNIQILPRYEAVNASNTQLYDRGNPGRDNSNCTST